MKSRREEIKRIIYLCEYYYPQGTYFFNAYNKIVETGGTTDDSVCVVNSRSIFKELKVPLIGDSPTDIHIVNERNGSNYGLLYTRGHWADICDSNGNIIKTMNSDSDTRILTDLKEIREWLYKE